MSLLLKKVVGVILMIAGVLALVTPFTPGSWLIFVGAELLGLRLWWRQKIGIYGVSYSGSTHAWGACSPSSILGTPTK